MRQVNESLEERVAERTRQVREKEERARLLARRLTRAEQEERRRVSQILHDDLQQLLYGVEMKVSMVRDGLDAAAHAELAESVEQTRGWIGRAIETTRQLTVDLSPPILDNEGLAEALEWLQRQMRELHGLDVTLEAERDVPVPGDDLRVLLFQVVREILFNVKKHAGVTRALVRLTASEPDGELIVEVTDEGKGFDPQVVLGQEEMGFGLYSARERLRLLDGRLDVRSNPGDGTTVILHAPLHAADSHADPD